jgi:hypothetical protein
VLLAVPGVFAEAALGRDGRLSPWMMYGAWWVVGLLPVAYVTVVRPRGLLGMRVGDPVRDVLSKVLLLAPVMSLIVHLCTANWVYKLDFYAANVAPLLVGLGVAIGHCEAAGYRRRVRWQLVLPGLAVLLSTSVPDGLIYAMPGPDWSSLRLVLLAVGVVYLDGYWVHRNAAFAVGVGACLIGFGMGPSVGEMGENAGAVADRTSGWLDRLTPQTPRGWGVASVVASFVLLGVGFVVSLLKPPAVAKIADDSVAAD